MRKRWNKGGMITLMMLWIVSVMVLSNGGNIVYAEGSGTASDPYIITTASQLNEVRNNLDAHYELENDIDLSGYSNWDPIGDYSNEFTGTFDGKGHVIQNLKINVSSYYSYYIGLFGVSQGTVKNVGIVNTNVTSEFSITVGGGLVGLNDGNVTNSYATGSVAGDGHLGGLVGENDGSITNSYATGSVTGDAYVGGLVGINYGNGSVTNSYATSSVTGDRPVGGLVGENYGSVTNSYATGSVTGDRAVGGLVGHNYGSVTNSYATGSVTGNDYIGGLIGYTGGTASSVSNSFWNTDTSGEALSAGGTGKTTANMKDQATFIGAGWDFTNTWTNSDGNTYPYMPVNYHDIQLESLTVTNTTGGGSEAIPSALNRLKYDDSNEMVVKSSISLGIDVTARNGSSTVQILSDGTPVADASNIPILEGTNTLTIIMTSADGFYSTSYTLTIISVDAPSISLYDSPTTPTNGSVEVSIIASVYRAESGNELTKLNWMPGSHPAADFAGGASGTDILSAKAFSVSNNGTYTVYAQDSIGNESVKEISITNILTTAPVLTLTPGPTTLTNGSVTVSITEGVYGEGSGNALAKLNWMPGSHTAADFAGGASGTDILSAKAFSVSTNGIYTVYAQDLAGNESVKEISITNILTTAPVLTLTPSPTTLTNGSVTVSVTATVYGEGSGNALTKLNWMPGSHPAADFAGGTSGTDILSAKAFSVSTNSIYTVYAQDLAGNESVKEISITNIRSSSDDDDDDPVIPTLPPEANITERQDGGLILHVDPSSVVKETLEDGTMIENVELSEETMEQVLEKLKYAEKPFVTIEVNDSEGAVKVQFPAASLSTVMESFPDAIFEVKLNGSSFQLEVNVLDLQGLAKQLGVNLQELKVNVTIKQVVGEVKEQLEQVADNQGLKLIGNAVDYKVTVSSGDQTIEVRDFGGTYMVRAIVLDEDVANKYITAVLYDPLTQMLSFVPAVHTTRTAGQQEMAMSVPHNSIYAIMEAEGKTFTDLNGHWAKKDVELLASKLIVHGVTDNRFAPDESITRAEFTALLVRSLGLATENVTASSQFVDVDANAWYAPFIEAAVKAELVSGLSEDYFAPNDTITREQMAVMFARSLALTEIPSIEVDEEDVLVKFEDHKSISSWAKFAVAQSIEVDIIRGITEDTIAPTDDATRAQATVMLKRFLQYVGFID